MQQEQYPALVYVEHPMRAERPQVAMVTSREDITRRFGSRAKVWIVDPNEIFVISGPGNLSLIDSLQKSTPVQG